MILDETLEFADSVAVNATAGTALIGDVIDLGAVPQDFGTGKPMYLIIQTTVEIITGGTAGTLQFKLASDAQAAIATDGSATDHLATAALVTDDDALNAAQFNVGGVIFAGAMPSGAMAAYERYLGILAVTATTTTTAGSINAFLTTDLTRWKSYADGVN